MKKLLFVFVFLCTMYLVLSTVLAQELTSEKAKSDYIFSEDSYKTSLSEFNLKKDSYLKNPTLSLKEETRVAFFDFLVKRNDYKRTYLTLLRTKVVESFGLTDDEKKTVYTKIDPEVVYYEKRRESYQTTTPLEDLLNKSKEEDTKYKTETLPVVYFTLDYISLGNVVRLRDENTNIYKSLKAEAENLVKLGRADSSLFERWFKDIDLELTKIIDIENKTRTEIQKVFSKDTYEVDRAYDNTVETISPVKLNLLQLNKFIGELENTILEKR